MEWIKMILPLIGVAIGWILSESGKILADKRQDKRKLRKLLFFLLELRFHFARELSNELNLDKYIAILKKRMAVKLGFDIVEIEFTSQSSTLKQLISELLSKTRMPDDKYEYLAVNIDKVLIELAEIFPLLAYSLNGQHNIKERLKNFDNYINDVESYAGNMPFDVKKWINPKLTGKLLEDLDESIKVIAQKIDAKKTWKAAKNEIDSMFIEDSDDEMEILISEYLDNVAENMPQ